MSIDFEAVGGVLLAVPDGTAPDRLTAVEDSLLLAWLAAAKAGSPHLDATLGKLGWILADAASQEQTLPLAEAGAAVLAAGATDGTSEALGARLAADRPDPVVAGWWERGEAAGFFALAQLASDGALRLASFSIALPSARLLVFARAPAVRVVQNVTTGTLNAGVFGTVAKALAAKVAPYRDQIVKA